MQSIDIGSELQQRVTAAVKTSTPLVIRGSGSKHFYGRAPQGEPLELATHCGLISYEPAELVLTARAGTPLAEIQSVLASEGQMLGFEPPTLGSATLGGTIACNLSGPRRPYAGAARDFVLGCRIINGTGERLAFGGEVMKNVAGYDISRLMAGAMGSLGVLLEISLKVLPRPEQELTLIQEMASTAAALTRIHTLARQALPISASAILDKHLYIRCSGTAGSVVAASHQIGGEVMEEGQGIGFWRTLREQSHPFFQNDHPLWRFSIGSDTPPLPHVGEWLYEWGGAQRWYLGDADAGELFASAAQCGGHATAYRNHALRGHVFQPLDSMQQRLHQNLKRAFDPHRILNRNRLYEGL